MLPGYFKFKINFMVTWYPITVNFNDVHGYYKFRVRFMVT